MSSTSSSATIKDLLHEVTDAVEPGDRLHAIRVATADTGRRTRRGWWTAGGVGLVARALAAQRRGLAARAAGLVGRHGAARRRAGGCAGRDRVPRARLRRLQAAH